VAGLFTRVGLPSITGFIATGIICGPYTLNIVEKHDLPSLSYINMFALAYITTSAGAELEMAELRPTIKAIMSSVTAVSLLVFGVCTGVTYALADHSLLAPVMAGMEDACQSSIALVNLSCAYAGTPRPLKHHRMLALLAHSNIVAPASLLSLPILARHDCPYNNTSPLIFFFSAFRAAYSTRIHDHEDSNYES
jgi:Kef-type K+ transport system membrane component KefB